MIESTYGIYYQAIIWWDYGIGHNLTGFLSNVPSMLVVQLFFKGCLYQFTFLGLPIANAICSIIAVLVSELLEYTLRH